MHIPKYWVKAEAEELNNKGEKILGICWGWSERSEGEARERAEERARQVAKRLAAGDQLPNRYQYVDRPIREERVREEPFGVITRSSYGSLILNCPDTMFIDVDAPRSSGGIFSIFKKLFGGKSEEPAYPEIETLRAFQAGNPKWSFRVYLTHSGFRYIATNGPQDPESEIVKQVMDAVGADPLYMKLCAQQKCFRARVSPKPWRCGFRSPGARFPFSNADHRNYFNGWKQKYDALEKNYASVKFLEAIGQHSDQKLQPAIKLHDVLCRASSDLPLA